MHPAAVTASALAGIVLVACSGGGGGAAVSPAPPAPSGTPAPVHASADGTCQLESQSRSLDSNSATSFTISNQTSDQLAVFWLDFDGKRVKYFDLLPGDTHQQGTYVTHPWVVADAAGNCLRLFRVTNPATIGIS